MPPGTGCASPPAELERQYAEHPWNINNLPRCTDSVLRWGVSQGRVLGLVIAAVGRPRHR